MKGAGLTSIAAGGLAVAGLLLDSAPLVLVAAIASIGAGIVVLRGSRRVDSPRETSAVEDTRPPQVAKAAGREGSVLVATLRNADNGALRVAGDLQRVLAGIVADERGAIDRNEAQTLIASFSRSAHAEAAVHAARRMLSNVDAVSRRLGHDLRISIAVHSGPRGDATLAMAEKVQSAATDSVPVLISEPAARHLGGQLERVETIAGEGWQMDVFTFPPAQRRLPGF